MMDVPARLSKDRWVQNFVKSHQRAVTRASNAREEAKEAQQYLESRTRMVFDAGIQLSGEYTAGVLDEATGMADSAVKPSFFGGLVITSGGVVARAPKVVRFGTGMMGPQAYAAGRGTVKMVKVRFARNQPAEAA